MKREYYYLIGILILALGFRLYNLRHEYFIGNDSFLHASVIRQALSNGNLQTYELSYDNPAILEPLGFYLVTLIPAMIFGLNTAFLLMPLISGVLCIFFSYLLIKGLFNKRVALITVLILAISVGHMYRSSPNTYRGDGFFLTIFIAILYFFNKEDQKSNYITGILMGLSATLWNGYPIGILVIISGLIIESTIKFLKGAFDKKTLTRHFTILALYYGIEYLLMLMGVVKRAFFTSNTGFHALIVFAPLILGLIYYLTRKVKKSNVLYVIVMAGGVLLLLNGGTITSMINEGLFENSLFFDIGVSELLPPTPELLHTMLSWTLYLMWPGLILFALIILKKFNPKHVTYLVWVGLSTYLLLSYSRYNFIASITAASLTALFIDYVYKNANKFNKNLALLILLVFFVPYAIDSYNNVQRIGPRMNSYWQEAITWAGQNLEPGMTVTWWDHGSWVQYYAGFPTVVDSVSGQAQDRIQRIARFLTTNEPDNFSDWNASYLMVGQDIVLYSGAVIGIAGTEGFVTSLVGQGVPAVVNDEVITVYPIPDGRFEVYHNATLFRSGQSAFYLNTTMFANQSGTYSLYSDYEIKESCLAITPIMNLYFNKKACDSNFVQLMYGQGLAGYEEVYRNDFVAIFRLT